VEIVELSPPPTINNLSTCAGLIRSCTCRRLVGGTDGGGINSEGVFWAFGVFGSTMGIACTGVSGVATLGDALGFVDNPGTGVKKESLGVVG
jgi:hypothetical protein